MACGTPIITTLTGGLQEQVLSVDQINHDIVKERNQKFKGTNIETDFGIGLEPASKAIIGSQQVPYIYEDRVCGPQVVDALMTMYSYGKEKREELGNNCINKILKEYSFEGYAKSWDDLIVDVYNRFGSWENRKNYSPWELTKV
jgi:glycosyltransferase involved in cell wall biosynthesis